jgi:hypothetical protein
MVMTDLPIQHEQPKHERRAPLIAQLHEQAITAANDDLSATQNTIKAGTRPGRKRDHDLGHGMERADHAARLGLMSAVNSK